MTGRRPVANEEVATSAPPGGNGSNDEATCCGSHTGLPALAAMFQRSKVGEANGAQVFRRRWIRSGK